MQLTAELLEQVRTDDPTLTALILDAIADNQIEALATAVKMNHHIVKFEVEQIHLNRQGMGLLKEIKQHIKANRERQSCAIGTATLSRNTTVTHSASTTTRTLTTHAAALTEKLKGLKEIIQHEAFRDALKDLTPLLDKELICFISYAWGNPVHEKQVEEFAKDLEAAGVTVLLDKWYDKRGADLLEFVEKVLDERTSHVLVIGSPLYLQKYNKRAQASSEHEHVVTMEVRLINYVIAYSRQRSQKVIPILLEGTAENALPPLLRPKLGCDIGTRQYFSELFKLIHDMYGFDNRDARFSEREKAFFELIGSLDSKITEEHEASYKESLQQQEADRRMAAAKKADDLLARLLGKYLPAPREQTASASGVVREMSVAAEVLPTVGQSKKRTHDAMTASAGPEEEMAASDAEGPATKKHKGLLPKSGVNRLPEASQPVIDNLVGLAAVASNPGAYSIGNWVDSGGSIFNASGNPQVTAVAHGNVALDNSRITNAAGVDPETMRAGLAAHFAKATNPAKK